MAANSSETFSVRRLTQKERNKAIPQGTTVIVSGDFAAGIPTQKAKIGMPIYDKRRVIGYQVFLEDGREDWVDMSLIQISYDSVRDLDLETLKPETVKALEQLNDPTNLTAGYLRDIGEMPGGLIGQDLKQSDPEAEEKLAKKQVEKAKKVYLETQKIVEKGQRKLERERQDGGYKPYTAYKVAEGQELPAAQKRGKKRGKKKTNPGRPPRGASRPVTIRAKPLRNLTPEQRVIFKALDRRVPSAAEWKDVSVRLMTATDTLDALGDKIPSPVRRELMSTLRTGWDSLSFSQADWKRFKDRLFSVAPSHMRANVGLPVDDSGRKSNPDDDDKAQGEQGDQEKKPEPLTRESQQGLFDEGSLNLDKMMQKNDPVARKAAKRKHEKKKEAQKKRARGPKRRGKKSSTSKEKKAPLQKQAEETQEPPQIQDQDMMPPGTGMGVLDVSEFPKSDIDEKELEKRKQEEKAARRKIEEQTAAIKAESIRPGGNTEEAQKERKDRIAAVSRGEGDPKKKEKGILEAVGDVIKDVAGAVGDAIGLGDDKEEEQETPPTPTPPEEMAEPVPSQPVPPPAPRAPEEPGAGPEAQTQTEAETPGVDPSQGTILSPESFERLDTNYTREEPIRPLPGFETPVYRQNLMVAGNQGRMFVDQPSSAPKKEANAKKSKSAWTSQVEKERILDVLREPYKYTRKSLGAIYRYVLGGDKVTPRQIRKGVYSRAVLLSMIGDVLSQPSPPKGMPPSYQLFWSDMKTAWDQRVEDRSGALERYDQQATVPGKSTPWGGGGLNRKDKDPNRTDNPDMSRGVTLGPDRDNNPIHDWKSHSDTDYPYMKLADIELLVPLMELEGVSEEARSGSGFLTAYKKAKGAPARLAEVSKKDGKERWWWWNKREGFNKRHIEQVDEKKRNGIKEELWLDGSKYGLDEMPSRRHLAFVAWAWTPHANKMQSFINRNRKALKALKGRKKNPSSSGDRDDNPAPAWSADEFLQKVKGHDNMTEANLHYISEKTRSLPCGADLKGIPIDPLRHPTTDVKNMERKIKYLVRDTGLPMYPLREVFKRGWCEWRERVQNEGYNEKQAHTYAIKRVRDFSRGKFHPDDDDLVAATKLLIRMTR